MEYVTPEYEAQLQALADVLVTPERYSRVVEASGQLVLSEVQD